MNDRVPAQELTRLFFSCVFVGTVAHIAGKNSHTLHLSGVFLGNVPVLVRAQLQLDESEGVVLKVRQVCIFWFLDKENLRVTRNYVSDFPQLVVRSDDIDVSELVTECIQ